MSTSGHAHALPIDLIWLGESRPPPWSGQRFCAADPTPAALHELALRHLPHTQAVAWLFWDSELGVPDEDQIHRRLDRPGDVWHAGLELGLAGKPGLMKFLQPTWMLNRDNDSDHESTSWRLSLSCCLIRTELLRQLGDVHPTFDTLAGAGLAMGHRYLTHGAIVRHVPNLARGHGSLLTSELSIEDEIRFAFLRFGRRWCAWAVARAALTRYASVSALLRAYRQATAESQPDEPEPYRGVESLSSEVAERVAPAVSVLIPTLQRYSYLRTLLNQLRTQTVRPAEILIIDQAPEQERELGLAEEFDDLPLKVFFLSQPGQCSSRNLGLQNATGDWVLFLDDDDEIGLDLIEKHLENVRLYRAEVSCGVADEVGAGPLPREFRLRRVSDVFPTNNSLIQRQVLTRSGLFDLAYERSQRADADLGMRIYLGGATMVLDPEISVLHHHAPVGGLRTHGARLVTYASSRSSITQRHLPSASEIYLARRFFSKGEVFESLWRRALGTFSIRGSWPRRFLKMSFSLALLPHTVWQIRRQYRLASAMLDRFPQIPELHSPTEEATIKAS